MSLYSKINLFTYLIFNLNVKLHFTLYLLYLTKLRGHFTLLVKISILGRFFFFFFFLVYMTFNHLKKRPSLFTVKYRTPQSVCYLLGWTLFAAWREGAALAVSTLR